MGEGKSARITCAAKKGKCDLRALYAEQWKSPTNAKTKFPNCLDCSIGRGRGGKAFRNSTGLCNIIDDIIAQWGQQRQKQHKENANEKLAATPKEQQQQ